MQSLFPTTTSSNQAIFQFRAGKCQLTVQQNGKFQVHADLRRGTVILSKGSDSLLHLKWSNLSSGSVEDDRIIMPGECVFKRVKTGRDTDRVYVLKFNYGNQRLLFWMQNKENNDEEVVKKVNEILNPSTSESSQPNSDWLSQMMGPNRDQRSIPSSSAANNAASNAASSAPTLGGLDFSTLLAQLANPQVPTATPEIPRFEARSAPPVSLSEIVNGEDVIRSDIFKDLDLVNELLSQLPIEQRTIEYLESTMRSPQLQQALISLSEALLNPENFNNVVRNFNLDPIRAATAASNGIQAFLDLILATYPPEENRDDSKMQE